MATPGLHVVTPATVDDAYGLLRAAIASDDPVVFLEPKRLYWSKADWSPGRRGRGADRPRGGAARRGRSATLITYGPSVPVCMEAAEAAASRGLGPGGRRPALAGAVRRRDGRARRCGGPGGRRRPESTGFGGPGGEIAARVTERCFHHLEAPVLRVAGFDIPYPPPMLERHHLPGVDRVLDAVARLQWDDEATTAG